MAALLALIRVLALAALATGTAAQGSAAWSRELDAEPFGDSDRDYHFNLMPALAGDKAVVSTSLRVYAIDVDDGSLIWEFGPLDGWSSATSKNPYGSKFGDIAWKTSRFMPVVDDGRVFAALQIPWFEPVKEWHGVPLDIAIPERRIFALDLESGRQLWSHWPLDRTENASGAGRHLTVSAPPTVNKETLLVPSYRMGLGIECSLAAYNCRDGTLLWVCDASMPVSDAVLARKRLLAEHVGSPVVVEGRKAVLQSNCGVIEAIDVSTGNVLWRHSYPSLLSKESTKPRYLQGIKDLRVGSAPIILGDLVVCLPSDGEELFALNLGNGTMEWSMSISMINIGGESIHVERIICGVEDSVCLLGDKLVCARVPSRTDDTRALSVKWTLSLGNKYPAPDVVWVPPYCYMWKDGAYCIVDQQGRITDRLGDYWPGNIVASGDQVLSLDNKKLQRIR